MDAGVDVHSIGYINTHGTGTNENDKSEWLGIKSVLKDYYSSVPVSSSKRFLGHTGGAAGIIEAVLTVLSMEEHIASVAALKASPGAFAAILTLHECFVKSKEDSSALASHLKNLQFGYSLNKAYRPKMASQFEPIVRNRDGNLEFGMVGATNFIITVPRCKKPLRIAIPLCCLKISH
jgi:hypothetical protein